MPTLAFLFWDPTMILLLPAIALALWAQARVKSAYKKYSQVPSAAGVSGADVARRILSGRNLDVAVKSTSGSLDDHYDPRNRSVNLSRGVHDGHSLAALAIAAHECGHALQHKDEWFPLVVRSSIAPTVGFGSMMAFPLFFVGFIFSSLQILMDIGIVFFALAVVFHLVTLPVEFDASRRALAILGRDGYLREDERQGAKRMLDAAALTYVAAAAVAVMHLLRLVLLRGSRS